jgi:hypothetical protein
MFFLNQYQCLDEKAFTAGSKVISQNYWKEKEINTFEYVGGSRRILNWS